VIAVILLILSPVCGVDGKTYGNTCEAKNVCVAIDHWGECKQATECPDNDQDGFSPNGGNVGA
jgi:ubiquitin